MSNCDNSQIIDKSAIHAEIETVLVDILDKDSTAKALIIDELVKKYCKRIQINQKKCNPVAEK